MSARRCLIEGAGGPRSWPPGLGFLVVVVLWGLAGCSSLHQGDGGPRGEIDFDSIPDAVPRAEPKSPYGNPVSYEVFGQRYYPLESSLGYQARGTASWYGPQFHGKRASIGEPYDMYAMTAAHKTLPLPSYARVTNLENGRSIVVRVNDRGPFHGDRLIDLSYVAAGKLRLLGPGTAPVEVRALSPEGTEPLSPSPIMRAAEQPAALSRGEVITAGQGSRAEAVADVKPTPRGSPGGAEARVGKDAVPQTPHLFVQAGAFGLWDNAERLRAHIARALPHQVRVCPTQSTHPLLYRVQVGPLRDRQLAESVSQSLAGLGVDHPHLIME